MTIAFVNGVPVTPAVWAPLITELPEARQREAVLLAPPGFGAPLPADFAATFDDYRNWLIDELSRFDAPVDLVGHSLAGGYVLEVAMTRPDLIRSWVSDTVAGYEPATPGTTSRNCGRHPAMGNATSSNSFREVRATGRRAWSAGASRSPRPARSHSTRARRWVKLFSRCIGPCPGKC